MNLKPGDSLLVDTKAGYAYERVPKAEVEDLVLEEVPDVDYSDIGGLFRQIEQIRDAVELPFLHAELFKEYELRPPKGVLLYGPPGCGKTLIAKAVANSLAKKIAAVRGDDPSEGRAFFLNIKGPELLNKFVGETERHIRLIFQRAREKASAGTPVIVFFDEMDSIFRTRGSGVSSDVETTIVPQLLAEIDGVEGLENVIVIGASNREDMIDPAILRPGRLDVKIKIERPDAEAAQDIFSKYLTDTLPIHVDDIAEFGGNRKACITAMIERIVERMYDETEENRFLEVTYANGDKETLYFKDFNSGAMIQNIVDRGKKSAIKAVLESGQPWPARAAPARRHRRRVRRERGPAQHHQPGRLGAHLRQEGRAHRLHPHAGHRQERRDRARDRHGQQHRPVPLSSSTRPTGPAHRAGPVASVRPGPGGVIVARGPGTARRTVRRPRAMIMVACPIRSRPWAAEDLAFAPWQSQRTAGPDRHRGGGHGEGVGLLPRGSGFDLHRRRRTPSRTWRWRCAGGLRLAFDTEDVIRARSTRHGPRRRAADGRTSRSLVADRGRGGHAVRRARPPPATTANCRPSTRSGGSATPCCTTRTATAWTCSPRSPADPATTPARALTSRERCGWSA